MKPQPARQRLSVLLQRGRSAFDARAPRERLLLAAALLAALLFVIDALWFTPALRAFRQARQQHGAVVAALSAAQAEQARRAAGGADPAQQVEQEIRATQDRVTALDRELREQAAGLVSADQMVAVLDQMLVRHPQVKVRAMRSLPRTDLLGDGLQVVAGTTATAASAPTAPASAPRGGSALYRHGVEIVLEGSYADLVTYLKTLDEQPQQLLAGGLQFRVEKHPLSTLTLRLYTLSMDRHWLEI